MKTIYNLQIGDSYWVKELCTGFVYKPVEKYIIGRHSLKLVKAYVENGELFLTEEDCQRSIDYDVALAKINKYVSEFSDAPDTMSEIVFNSHPQEIGFYIIERNGYVTQSSPLVFKTKNAHRVLKELPNEVKTVLGVS